MEPAFKFENPRSNSCISDSSGSGEDVDHGLEELTIITNLPESPLKGPKSPLKAPKSPTKSGINKKISFTTSSKSQRVYQSGLRTLYTSGRPPWYDSHGSLKEPFVIGVCGGSASGKTTVARKIIEALDVPWVSLLSLDSFYKVLNEEMHETANRNEYNFDHPDAFDFDLLIDTLRRLKDGKSVEVPIYNFITHSRDQNTRTIYGANVVIFEGIMSFVNKELLDLMDMKIFVDTDSDVRLARRLKRDIAERGRELEGVLKQYNTFVKPAFDHWISPTMSCADIIVPRGGENIVAIQLVVLHVHGQLQKRGFKLRSKLAHSADNGCKKPDTLFVLEQTPQIQGLHTFVRNRETPRDEFIFYSKRLMRLLFEYAVSLLPFKTVSVDTPQGTTYHGRRLDADKICGVSILRAGETMEQALCEVCKDVRLGKILIQTNFDTGEPELHYLRLPKDIKESQVILMDATVATGAAAMMAIRVLLDHDVPEENITLTSLLMAESGVHSVAYAFPKVKIVTTAVDKEVNEKFHILPGIGNFGDRYFGTDFEKLVQVDRTQMTRCYSEPGCRDVEQAE
ncbi:uridine-cytidine kinase-like 1 isoform X2 [Mytilus californianus]|uniref:uridine-cytidine kinase-like 1 isoform X2 n=1 Tax=Mytilus californianus TaxID=6549 RepID=UPI0022473DF3|nr:uridine-cytidine kinase-like 1 isoform X2 [Mytilus californianus]